MIHILIPTRNRLELLRFACESLTQGATQLKDESFAFWVSDNSTPEIADEVRAFVETIPAIRYLRPPNELSMTEHWNWAIEEVLRDKERNGDYLGILTDRFACLPGKLDSVARIVSDLRPDLLSFGYDTINDSQESIFKISRKKWSKRVTWISRDKIFEDFRKCHFKMELPRLLNCVVRVEKLDEIRQTAGQYMVSISPDFSFCMEYLAQNLGIYFLSDAVFFQHGLNRSNGFSSTIDTGKSKEHEDFMSFLPKGNHWSAPVGDIHTLLNGVVHELEVARSRRGRPEDGQFPEIDIQAYGNAILLETRHRTTIDRRDLKERLVRLGWRPRKFCCSLGLARQWIVSRLEASRIGFRMLSYLSNFGFVNSKRKIFSDRQAAISWLHAETINAEQAQ